MARTPRNLRSNVVDETPLGKAERARPRRSATSVPRTQRNVRRQAMFMTNDESLNHVQKIAFLADGVNPEDDRLTRAAITALGDRYLRFKNGLLVTDDADIVAWLRYRIKHKRITNITEDVPQPIAVIDGDRKIYTDVETGERLYTREEIMAELENRAKQAEYTEDDHLKPEPDRSPPNTEYPTPPTPDIDPPGVELGDEERNEEIAKAAHDSTTDIIDEDFAPENPAKPSPEPKEARKAAPKPRRAPRKVNRDDDGFEKVS